MDMSTVKGLTISEGSVNQITGPDGQIWWLAADANKVYYNMIGDHYFTTLYPSYDVTSIDSLNAQNINIPASTKSYDLMNIPNASNISSVTISGRITSSASENFTCEITLGDSTVINPAISTTSNVDYTFNATTVNSWNETKQILNIRVMNSNYSYSIEIYLAGSKVVLKTYGTNARSNMRTVTIKNLQVIFNYPVTTYRQLEYLEGTDIAYGFDSKVSPALNSYMIIDFEHINNNGSGQMGRGAVSNNQRFAIGFGKDANNNYTYFGGLGASWNTFNTYTSGKHRLGVQGPKCNVLNNAVGTSTTKKGYLIDDTFNEVNNTVNSTTWYTAYLFGSRGNTNDSNAGQGVITGKFYYAEVGYSRTDNYAQGINGKYYPAQRKSDGQLGIVRLNDSGEFVEFLTPRSGETGTYTAGPTANESPSWSPLN